MSYEEDQRLIQNTEKKIAYEDGFEQGTEQRNIEIAKNLISLGTITLEDISKTTGLSVEKLTNLSSAK